MLACTYSSHNATPSITEQKIPVANTAVGQLLVKVHASAINPIDHVTHKGTHYFLFNFKWPRTFGFDFAGIVEEADDDQMFKKGDRVFGQIAGLPQRGTGTVANYIVVSKKYCVKIPENISFIQASAMPLVSITAFNALKLCGISTNSDTNKKPRVLVTGGAGGVGSQAIQMAKNIFNASFVVTTASSGKKETLCKTLGADMVIDYKTKKFEMELLCEGEDDKKFDAIVDCTGEAWKCIKLLKKGGGICSITTGPTIEAMRIWLNGAGADPNDGAPSIAFGVQPFIENGCGGSLINYFAGGSGLQKACINQGASFHHLIGAPAENGVLNQIALYLKEGKLKPVIDKVFAFNDSVDAIQYQKGGRCAGKVIIEIIKDH
jgi:NADPH:quinone reductase-like Zn-dependent oxidoreductase